MFETVQFLTFFNSNCFLITDSNTAKFTSWDYSMQRKTEKIRIKGKTQRSPVVWVWGWCGDSHRFFYGCEIGRGLKSNPTAAL